MEKLNENDKETTKVLKVKTKILPYIVLLVYSLFFSIINFFTYLLFSSYDRFTYLLSKGYLQIIFFILFWLSSIVIFHFLHNLLRLHHINLPTAILTYPLIYLLFLIFVILINKIESYYYAKEGCIKYVGGVVGIRNECSNISDCRIYEKQENADECYVGVAEKKKDFKICLMMKSGMMKNACISNIALQLKDPKICNFIDKEEENWRENLEFCLKPTKPTSTPVSQAKIVSVSIEPKKCNLKIVTTDNEFIVTTGLEDMQKLDNCVTPLHRISPLKLFAVIEGLSGGIDSVLKVFSAQHNDIIQLDVLGTSEIFDIKYLPDDRLVVLSGYKGVYKEQYLKIYNLAGLFNKYPTNVHKQYKYFTDLNQYSKNITLPDIGKNYQTLSVRDDKLIIYGIVGDKITILQEYGLEELNIK